ncbi:MAG: hypothetical protein WC607_01130 [Candidatus Micrarchaeia archaeon]
MGLLVTTSRKPGALTRRLARWLGRFLGDCDNRGKSPLSDIVARAESKGYSRVLFIYERHGNPCELSFYEEDWIEPAVQITGIDWVEAKEPRLPAAAFATGKDATGKKIAALFALEKPEGRAVEIKASENEISFTVNGERVGPKLKIKVIENG